MKLVEILDKPVEMQVVRDTEKSYRTKATIGGREVEFRLDQWPERGKWNFTFVELDDDAEDGETYDATGKGNEFQVFASAKKFIEDGIKSKSPKVIYFEADKMKSASRAKLYDRFVKRWQPTGYKHRKLHNNKDTDYHAYVEKSFYAQTYKDEEE